MLQWDPKKAKWSISGCIQSDSLLTVKSSFFKHNRHALQEKLGSGALIVVTGYSEMQHTHDMAAPFVQEGNFWYLSGIEAPDWWLIIEGSGTSFAVAPDINSVKQTFDGSLDVKTAKAISGVDRVIGRDEAAGMIRSSARAHSLVYTVDQPKFIREHSGFHLNPAQHELRQLLERSYPKVQDCMRELATLRTIKQPEEIEAITQAVSLTMNAFKKMKTEIGIYKYEYEAEACLTHEIRRHGASGHAYQPIVAGGEHACTLHYVQNDAHVEKRSLLLFDVGARWGGYCADISRTYAIAKPLRRAAAVHDAVREAQAEIIALMEPGLGFVEYQRQVDDIMGVALTKLKLDPEKLHDYMPHAVGHGLGIDVHDTLAGYDSLQPGMVLTVEPGIYLPMEGIGVRIEDDILITKSGHKNLSGSLDTSY